MRLRLTRLLFSALLLTDFLTYELDAQTTTSGALTGVVTDPSHAVVHDADIKIKDTSKGFSQATRTDQEGVYRFSFLRPGRYVLAVVDSGFRTENRDVTVRLGATVSVNVQLEIAQANANITVPEEVPFFQAENGDASATMSQTEISEVPNPGNDLTYLAQTAAGIVMNTANPFARFSSLGMPGTSNLFTVDGVNDNDNAFNIPLAGPSGLVLGQNQIQEATVVTVGYSGQFGGAAGANVNYFTKSGSNRFHGNAEYFWNGRLFNANDWFNNALGYPRPFEIANQWAASIGGPIKKNKLFFFFDSEGIRVLIPQLYFVSIPSREFEAATIANIDSDPRFGPGSATDAFYKKIFGLYNAAPGASSAMFDIGNLGCAGFEKLGEGVPCARFFFTERGAPSADTLVSGRLDWQVSNADRTFLRVQYDRGHNALGLDAANGLDLIDPLFDASTHQQWWQGQVTETHTFGSAGASQFRLAASYYSSITQLDHPSQAVSAFPASLSFVGTFTTLAPLNSALASPAGRPTTQYQIAEDFVKTWGSHKFGVGANFDRIDWTDRFYTTDALGSLTAQSLDAFYQGGVDPASSSTDFTELTQSFPSAASQRIAFYNATLYGQDEWHVRKNLALTLSLRAEHYSNPVCRHRCFARTAGPFGSLNHDPDQPYNQGILTTQEQAFESTDSVLWSPRFSFAWQPFGVVNNTVIRGGLGVFYDPVPGILAHALSLNFPLFDSYAITRDNLTPNETTNLFQDAFASNMAFRSGFAAGETLADIKEVDHNFSPPGFTTQNGRIRSPQYQRWSLELQHAFGAKASFTVGYFGHHGIHGLVHDPNANAYGFGSLPKELCTGKASLPCADPRFRGVTELTTNAISNYNGMVVSLQRRFSAWGQGMFQANYTYGHAFDEVSNGGQFGFTFASAQNPQDPNNLRDAYGPAEYDVRHSFNASYVWEVPVKAAMGGRGGEFMVKGWQISGTIFARTGFPYTVLDFSKGRGLVNNNYFGPIYAVPVSPLRAGDSCGEGAAFTRPSSPCQPPQLSRDGTPNQSAHFVQAGCETGFNTGTLGPSDSCGGPSVSFAQRRNRFRGPGYFTTDFAIIKNTKLKSWESATLGIGFQFFNLFNHPNFSIPDNDVSDQQFFGQIGSLDHPPTSILGSGLGGDVAPRMIQLKVQLQF